ncbi:NUDIX domain-containing protein [Candidatus Pelagibacter sp.]|jgi:8-oxo-dGTP pyrophosphatase MutT (NUDIX family)|nr:NUDIX domain-containing protein [Candidatus Pelagibacter sp.]
MTEKNSEFTYFLNQWKIRFLNSKSKILDIKTHNILSRKKIKFLSALIDVKLKRKLQKPIHRFCLLVPESVVIVPILIYKKKKFTMMVEQQRVDDGIAAIEFAAGAIHKNESIKDAAQKEILEELKININKTELKILNKKGVRMDPSMSSSKAYFFYFIKKINKNFFNTYKNRLSGVRTLDEFLKIKIIDLKKVKNIDTSSAIIGLKFIEDKFGKIE